MIAEKEISFKRQFGEIGTKDNNSPIKKRFCSEKNKLTSEMEKGETENKVQMLSRIVFFNDYQDTTKNVIWMNNEDIRHLFSNFENTPDTTSKFVQLANRVYEVGAKTSLPNNCIGLSHAQYSDIKKHGGIFMDNDVESIIISSFNLEPKNINKLANVIFEISLNKELECTNGFRRVLNLEQLRQDFKSYFLNKIIVTNQNILVDHYMGQFRFNVKEMHSHPDVIKRAIESKIGKSPFGFIDFDTEINFQVKDDSEILILDKILSAEDSKFHFSITLLDNTDKVDDSNYAILPLILNSDRLRDQVEAILKNVVLFHGMTFQIVYNNFWHLQFELSKIDSLNPFSNVEFFPRNHQVGYKGEEYLNIDFIRPSKDLLLVRGEPVTAEVLSLEVIHASQSPFTSHPIKNLLWISVDEIKEKLMDMSEGFARSQFLNLTLDCGYVVVKIKDAWTSETDRRVRNLIGKRLWTIDYDTKLKFSSLPEIKSTMVNNKKSYRISHLNIKIPNSAIKNNLLSQKELEKYVREKAPPYLLKDQKFKVKTKGNPKIHLTVNDITFNLKTKEEGDFQTLGTIGPRTKIHFESENKDSFIFEEEVCLAAKDPAAQLEEMGLGGLSKECKEVLADLVSSRGRLKELVEDYGIKPIKGLLFYGPPGTGKTTLARHLSKILGIEKSNIQMISGPEVLIKWVGDSEKKVRELFKPAKDAALKHKKNSPLFMVVVDEIDSILTPRGSEHAPKNGGSIVGQFLAEMDGLSEFNNLIVIGTTNRKDQIDAAMLRPGRFVPMEVGIPDAKGRKIIFEIHTRRHREKKRLGDDVDFEKLVNLTEGFVGADIQAIVTKASSMAHRRLNQLEGTCKELMKHPDGIVRMSDFEEALGEINKLKENGFEFVRHMFI